MLVAEHMTQRFGNLVALDDVSIEFQVGEIHAVLGENGAGKSTLMNVLAGFLAPTSGRVALDGKLLPLGDPRLALQLGIGMVHQHFRLVPAFTVAENLALARLGTLGRVLNVEKLAKPGLDAAQTLGWAIDPQARVVDLSVGAQQRVEILKCLGGDASVIVFDEPTAVLSPNQVIELFGVLRELRSQGKIVILIAHKLSEVIAIADRVTVLRHGKRIASALIGETNEAQLARWMVGEMPALREHEGVEASGEGLKAVGLLVRGDRGEEAVRGIDLEVLRGEIVGIGGVDGNGQVELAEALAFIRRKESGSLDWNSMALDPRQVSIAYIPQDRLVDGLALSLSVRENMLISGQYRTRLRRGPFVLSKKVSDWAKGIIARFDINPADPGMTVSNLSGGNQQKVIVGRNLDDRPDLLVAVNPTRGLDVKATRFVHEQILQARQEGAAVALFTTDLDELAALSDRRLFMSRGQLLEGEAAALLGGPS